MAEPSSPSKSTPELIDLAAWWGRNAPAVPQIGNLLQRGARARTLKRILPIVALLLIAGALLWPLLAAKFATRLITEALTPELAMLNLDYSGTDKSGRPFTVEAEKAVRQATAKPATSQANGQIGTVALTAPSAVLQQEGGQTVNLKAATGVYNEAQQGLTLDGTVQVGNSNGVKVMAPDLAVDLKNGRAWTDKPVTATGDFGRIDGQGLRLEDGGKRIIFTGKSRAVLNGAAAADTQSDAQPAPQAE